MGAAVPRIRDLARCYKRRGRSASRSTRTSSPANDSTAHNIVIGREIRRPGTTRRSSHSVARLPRADHRLHETGLPHAEIAVTFDKTVAARAHGGQPRLIRNCAQEMASWSASD